MKFEMLTPQEVEAIHAASVNILANTGVEFLGQEALEAFAAAGANVDRDRKLVKIPEKILDPLLQKTSDHFRLWNRSGDAMVDLRDGRIRGHNVGGCVRIFDFEQNAARDATQHDLEQMTTLLDALDNIHVCRPVVYPSEFPPNMWDIYTAATMLQFTQKPYGVTAYSPENLAYILQLASVIAGSTEALIAKPFIWGSVCPDSPLSYSERTSDILVRYAEVGLPVAIAPCPIAGASSPVTLAGTVAQLNAEFLAGLALVQIIRPGLDVKYTGRPMPMNMRTGTATFGSIEMGMMSAALVHLSKRYRVCSDSYGLGTRSAYLDEQAAYEKALNGVLVGLAGADLIAAAGLLQDALTSSVEQLVVDNEILAMIFRAARGIEVTDETLATETIMHTGPKGSFLSDRHTRRHMRTEHFQPRLANPIGGQAQRAATDHSGLQVARDIADAILKSHRPAQPAAEIVAEIGDIVARATRNLQNA